MNVVKLLIAVDDLNLLLDHYTEYFRRVATSNLVKRYRCFGRLVFFLWGIRNVHNRICEPATIDYDIIRNFVFRNLVALWVRLHIEFFGRRLFAGLHCPGDRSKCRG